MNSTKTVGVCAISDGGRYSGLAFRDLDVSGFYEGLGVLSYVQPSDGFSDILIEQVSLHHNLQGGGSTYGSGWSRTATWLCAAASPTATPAIRSSSAPSETASSWAASPTG